jgi:dTDP-4-dehydrorhamnose reductase
MRRILVTGKTGQVSSAIQALASSGIEIVAVGRPAFDLADPATIANTIANAKPDLVISAAAYTAVDRAESEPALAFAINAQAAGHIGTATAALGVPVIHLSTDYVFDGTKPAPYAETDATNPLGVYGKSKCEGERLLLAANPRAIILRTSWVFAAQGTNFLRTMLRLACEREMIRVVGDQVGAPVFADDIAAACLDTAKQVLRKPDDGRLFGIFHLASGGETSWAGFAEAIFEEAKRHNWPAAKVEPITTAEYPTAARRPTNSRLDCSKIAEIFGISLPHWSDGMRRCMAQIAAGNRS